MSARVDSSTARSTTTSPSPTRSSWPSWWRDMCRQAPSAIQPIVRAAAGDVGHQLVGRAGADGRGHGVLVLEPQHVAGPAGDAVERDADVDEPAVALVEQGEVVGRHEQVGVGGPPQRLHVAQPAVAVLEVRLEQERDVAGLGAPLDHLRAQGVEPAPAVATPPGQPLGGQPGRPAPRRRRGSGRSASRSPCRGRRRRAPAGRRTSARRGRASARRPTAGTRARSPPRRCPPTLPSWTSSTSTSLCGASSPRP